MDDKKTCSGCLGCPHCVASSATAAETTTAENAEREVVGKATYASSSVNQSAIIVDGKSHGCWARHKSYALWLATCYNKRWVRAHTTQQTSADRFNFRIGQTFVELVWTTTYKRFSKSPAYITQLLGVSLQIIRRLGVSRLMYARH